MSYKINKIGPWPNIDADLGRSVVSGVTDVAWTGVETLIAWTNTANVGGTSDCAINFVDASASALASYSTRTYGVFLQTLENIGPNENTVVDINMAINCLIDNTGSTSANQTPMITPIIGFCDNSTGIGSGFDADNQITNYSLLPDFDNTIQGCRMNTQVLLRNIISADISSDVPLFVGVRVINLDGTSVTPVVEGSICARYATGSIPTSYRGV